MHPQTSLKIVFRNIFSHAIKIDLWNFITLFTRIHFVKIYIYLTVEYSSRSFLSHLYNNDRFSFFATVRSFFHFSALKTTFINTPQSNL